MKHLLCCFIMACGSVAPSLLAAEIDPATIQSLKNELEDLRRRTHLLEQRITELEAAKAPLPNAHALTNAPPVQPPANQPSTTPVTATVGTAASVKPTAPRSPAQPITLMRAGSSYMNISFDAVLNAGGSTASDVSKELELGDHDPAQRGFSMRNAEIALDGAVDPYFKGFANVVLKLDNQNETQVELEEAYLMSTSLPANLQLKAGQFFAEFGRENTRHPHQWSFVDQPLILNRAFGPEGLRNPGARLSWLLPTPFYTEFLLGVFNGQGGTAFSFRDPDLMAVHGRTPVDRSLRGVGDLLYVPRLSSSFDLTDQQTLVLGASAAFAPNDSGPHARTQIYGLDTYWKWKSGHADAGFPFVSWQNEALYRHYDAATDPLQVLRREVLRDWGFYSQVLWGFRPRWVAGLRGEYVNGETGQYDALDVFRGERARVSPNLTFYPSEFSKIRLQYNVDRGQRFDVQHSVWLQLEFLLGAHGAHKF